MRSASESHAIRVRIVPRRTQESYEVWSLAHFCHSDSAKAAAYMVVIGALSRVKAHEGIMAHALLYGGDGTLHTPSSDPGPVGRPIGIGTVASRSTRGAPLSFD